MVVLTDRMPAVRSVTLGFFFRTGARHEPDNLQGISHFIEHAVFKGTSRRSMLDIAVEQDRLGGNLDAFTTHEEVGFAIKVIDNELPAAFDLLADMTARPRFDEADLEAEQRVIIEEMKMVEDSPEDHLGEIFGEQFFPQHPLGRSITGTPETVRSFGADVTRDYHAREFTTSNLVIVAAGNVEHDVLLQMVRQADLGLPDGRQERVSRVPTPAAPIAIRQRDDLEQAHLILATPFVAATDPRRYTADLVSSIIGGGTSSRLFQKIREERGLAYTVGAGAVMFQDCGTFSVSVATSPQQTAEVVELVVAELRDIVRNGISDAELSLAKQQAETSVLLSLEDSSARAAALAQSEMVHGRQISLEETLACISAVTVGDCSSLAVESLAGDRLAFVAIGDLAGLDITREKLTI